MLEDENGLYQDRNCEMLFGGNQDNEIITFFFKVENEEYNILFNVYYQTKALYFLLSKYKLLIFVCFCSLFVVFCRLCGSVPLMDFLNVSGNILSFAPKHLSFFLKTKKQQLLFAVF